MDKMGSYAFVGGIALAVLVGLGLNQSWVPWALAVLGLIVGFLNVTRGEANRFLLAAIGLMLSATAIYSIPFVGNQLTRIMVGVAVFIAPAVLVVAVRSLLETARR